jgi:hypothetical protein
MEARNPAGRAELAPGRRSRRQVALRCLDDSVPIRAGISTRDVSTDADLAWGPAFTLSPFFIDDGSFLLGRADFFSVFTVTFEEGRGRVFHLDTSN